MREIKFRGKTIEPAGLRQAGEWAYGGYFMDDCYGGCPEGKHYIVEWTSTGMGYHSHTQVVRESVGQYTGLKDKNGVEIYEGDILLDSVDGYRWVVEYDNELVALWLRCVGTDDHIMFDEFNPSKDLMVIGNIYENPELLEGQENETKAQ